MGNFMKIGKSASQFQSQSIFTKNVIFDSRFDVKLLPH